MSCGIFPQVNFSKYLDFSQVEIFELFIDDDVLGHMQKEMTLYSMKKNWPDINVQKSELKVFIAILLLTRYSFLPRKPLYWSKSPDVFNEAISYAMRRDRFDNIMKPCISTHQSQVAWIPLTNTISYGLLLVIYRTLDDTKIEDTRWKDNAVVTVASTLLGESHVGNTNRWSKKDCKRIQVTIPHVFDIYNQNMGVP